MSDKILILASASPRRSELLSSVGVNFEVIASQISEVPQVGELPQTLVARLSKEKSEAVAAHHPTRFILGADTVVVLKDQILGKPAGAEEAEQMLSRLQSNVHRVVTGFTLLCSDKKIQRTQVIESEVKMASMGLDEIRAYVATGEPLDKAGAYAVQGIGAGFIESVNGSYTAVVGLPLAEVLQQLKQLGLWTPNQLS